MSDVSRRALLGSIAVVAGACTRVSTSDPPAQPFDIAETTLDDLAAGLASGELTSESITSAYLQRIEEIDRSGPALNSVIELNPDALDIARELDQERADSGARGPLHGVPILLKDNIDTGDRMQTTAGSLALEGSIAAEDSGVAAALRRAGAVLLGKTNLSEWANFRSFDSTSGWSSRGGLTKNPYALNRNACGSSTGSGVAVAASLCAAAIGTETNGSIICPSSINGIVGVKPTVGLVSRSGIIPISETQDTAGPMARTVRDAALVLDAISGWDPRDPATAPADIMKSPYADALDGDALRGARLGVAQNYLGERPRVDARMEEAFEALRQQGAELVDVTLPPTADLGRIPLQIMQHEFRRGLNAYLSRLGPDIAVKSLSDIIAFNKEHADRTMPFFDQSILEASDQDVFANQREYQAGLAKLRKWARDDSIDGLMDEHSLDALIAPSTGPAWATDLVHGDRGSGGSSSPAARAGYPSVTVPAGYVLGLPVGLSFFGPAWTEAKLLGLAYSYEQATKLRKPPEYREFI